MPRRKGRGLGPEAQAQLERLGQLDEVLTWVVDLCKEGGALYGNRHRGELSGRAKWMRRALERLRAEVRGEPPPAVATDEPDAEERARIAADIRELHADRLAGLKHGGT